MSIKIGDRITHKKVFDGGLNYDDFRFNDNFPRVEYYVYNENKDVIGYMVERPIVNLRSFQKTLFLKKEEVFTLEEAISLLDSILEERKEKILRSLYAIK